MSDYWGIPEQEHELSLLQLAMEELSKIGYSVLSEKVEVCSGAGALTVTAVIKTDDSTFGLYLHDGQKQRKSKGHPVIRVLSLLPGMENADDLRNFVLSHQHDFYMILAQKDRGLKEKIEADLNRIYSFLYNSTIKNLYEKDLSNAADILRIRLRK